MIAPIIHSIIPERVEKFDFTYSYANSYNSFALAKPNLEPRWKSVYYPLSTGVWIAVIGHVVFFPFLLWQLIRAGHDGNPNVGVGAVFQDMVGMLLGQNLPRRVSYTSSSRVLVAAWLVFALILGLAYRGNLTASLTLPKYPPRPETLKEIINNVDMVTMPSYGEHFRKFYSDSESPLFQALGSLMNPGPSLMEGLKMALVKRSSHLDGRKYIQYQILDKFTEKDGSTPFYVTREFVSHTPAGWPIPHDAPYKAHLDRLIVGTLEAGLYDKWTADLMRETKLRSQRRQRQRYAAGHEGQAEPKAVNEDGLPTLTINHTQGAFILLLLGFVFNTLIFSSELLCKI
ncbi:ionotropic receptor 21a-like [Scylla paramamosain]|uniref:ionotropic receptor 21a-like n=1 Tax=Scylla paramamosain TaxID=85552 RepID=UPI0030837970